MTPGAEGSSPATDPDNPPWIIKWSPVGGLVAAVIVVFLPGWLAHDGQPLTKWAAAASNECAQPDGDITELFSHHRQHLTSAVMDDAMFRRVQEQRQIAALETPSSHADEAAMMNKKASTVAEQQRRDRKARRLEDKATRAGEAADRIARQLGVRTCAFTSDWMFEDRD
jgi:hypothetical protein